MPTKQREPFDPRTQERLRATGDHLRTTRKKLGISRAKLAAALDMHLMNYARIEQGKHNVTVEMLSRIADALGVELTVNFPTKKTTAESV